MNKQFLKSIPFAATLVALSFMMVTSAIPVVSVFAAPRIHNDSVSSTNWSGYAVTGSSGSVTDATGSWTVPAIQGSCPSTNQYSSFWVGIDGYNSGTVEQTGTDSDCQGGVPTYYAWFEFFPHASVLINGLTIHPGDVMSADAHFAGRSFTVTITDKTTGGTFSTSSSVRRAQRSSAEWIAEAPSSSGGILPLADFATVSFSAGDATISGTTGTIGSFGANVHQITMVTSGGATKASPSALSGGGDSFSVRWVSSGP
jgi:hypothetical protein